MGTQGATTRDSDGTEPSRTGISRCLIVICDGKTTEHPLPQDGTVIVGRGPTCDVIVQNLTLSRAHAKFVFSDRVTVEDCNSQNGVFLGGRRLAAGEVLPVAPGVPIELGDALLLVRADAGESDLPPANSKSGEHATSSLWAMIARIGSVDVPVLLHGEPGSGKDYVARQIHETSDRHAGPLFELLCDGDASPTHADIDAAVTQAQRGSLLIREPSALSLEAQALLCLALDNQTNVRLITTSTSDLSTLGAPLRHRLASVSIEIPPLRSRVHELQSLAESLLEEIALETRKPAVLLSADAVEALERHRWPGNVRELRDVLTQAVLARTGRVLTSAHLTF
jgi:two-component system response regulator AtoC